MAQVGPVALEVDITGDWQYTWRGQAQTGTIAVADDGTLVQDNTA